MASITQMPGNVKFIIQIPNCYLHNFNHRIRQLVSQGNCQIFQSTSNDETPNEEINYYLKISNYFKIFKKSQLFIKLAYANTACYIFYLGDCEGIFCLSFPLGFQGAEKIQIDLAKNFMVVDYSSELIDEKIRERTKINCPQNLQQQDISYQGKRVLKKVRENIGLIAGKASTIFQGQSAKNTVSVLNDKVNHFYDETLSDNVKSKWNSVKEAAEVVNSKMTVVVAPVMKLIDNISTQVGKSFYSSENGFVKTVRQYSLAFSQSLNEGQRKGRQNHSDKQNQIMREEVPAKQFR